MAKRTFQVSVGFDCVSAENELEAAKIIAGWLKDDADSFIFDVEDEETKVKVTVDLSEDDEDAVLPNDKQLDELKEKIRNMIKQADFINFTPEVGINGWIKLDELLNKTFC